jgi:serine/threonine protein phosphatase PrpC
VSKTLSEDQLTRLLTAAADGAAAEFVVTALELQADDNVTAVLVDVLFRDAQPTE